MSARLQLDVFLAVDLPTATEAQEALDALAAAAPAVRPVKASPDEPVRTRYSAAVVEDGWEDRFLLWRGERGSAVFGSLDGGGDGAPARVTVTAAVKRVQAEDLLNGLHTLVARYGAQFGFVHPLTEGDRDRFGPGDPCGDPAEPQVVLVEDDMRRWLPQLFWATVVGPPFADVFGAARLRTAPAAATEEIAPGTFLLRLAGRAADVVEAPERVDEVRRRVQAHLGDDAFWDPRKDVHGPYRSVGAAPRSPRAPAQEADPADVVAQLVRDLSSVVAEMLADRPMPYPVGLLRREDGTTDTVVIGDESDSAIAAARLEEALSAMRAEPGVVAVGAVVTQPPRPADAGFVDIHVAHRAAPPVHVRRSFRRHGSQVELGPPSGMA